MTAQSFDPNDFAYTAVVYLNVNIGGSTYRGSGVLISPDEVLTADHLVYDNLYGLATGILVAPAYGNGVAPFGIIDGTVAHYNPIVDNPTIPATDSQNDFAIIHLAQPVPGAGNMVVTSSFAAGAVHVTGYPGFAGQVMVDDAQSVAANLSYTIWDGTLTGAGSSGGPVWVYGADGRPDLVGLVSAQVGASSQRNVRITADKAAQIAAWVKADDAGLALPQATPPTAKLSIYDTTTKQAVADVLSKPFEGALGGIVEQYVTVTADSLNITAHSPNYFIHTGGGNDAVQLLAGTNVVDGGTGSNFMVSGEGRDTFFIDDRSPASSIWSTVSRFHSGDFVTVFGIGPATAALSWVDNEGAAGASGLTLHASVAGRPMASLTLAGFTKADLASGKIQAYYGGSGADQFLNVQAN